MWFALFFVFSRGGRQLPMSIDHKPGRKGERRRILRSGGYLDETDPKHPRVVRDNYNVRTAKGHRAFILQKL